MRVGISAGGNDAYDPAIDDTGLGGTTQGIYDLRLNFRPDADRTIIDATGIPLDGDADGVPGGVYNTWFRDENLQNSLTVDTGNGPDTVTNYTLQRRGKRHDYITGALPWPQKGNTAVTLPLGTTAPVSTGTFYATTVENSTGSPTYGNIYTSGTTHATAPKALGATAAPAGAGETNSRIPITVSGLTTDLTAATAATINQIRQAFQIQKLLERDARGGTRYTEIIRAHFGVVSPDARLMRPEYLGGGSTPITFNQIVQTGQTGLTGGTTPLGTLGAIAHSLAQGHGFTQSFTEHGHIIGLVSVRADLTYQQGLRRMWSRSTRYDFYFPAFAMLGEQAVLNKEVYCDGSANDAAAFGYQERWSEYKYNPSQITGLFRSTSAGTIDGWHLAQKFTALPTLNATFIADTPPVSRVVAVGAAANGQQLLFDSFFQNRITRPMPLYSVPGLIDHF
jgi:hypothetical protein